MFTYVRIWLVAFAVFMTIDLVWLGIVARDFYRRQLGTLMATQVNWPAAIVFYSLYIVGIMVFALLPALRDGELMRAILLGAFFGFITYATYDLTNLATLEGWPLKLVIVDISWGTVLAASTSAIAFAIIRYFGW